MRFRRTWTVMASLALTLVATSAFPQVRVDLSFDSPEARDFIAEQLIQEELRLEGLIDVSSEGGTAITWVHEGPRGEMVTAQSAGATRQAQAEPAEGQADPAQAFLRDAFGEDFAHTYESWKGHFLGVYRSKLRWLCAQRVRPEKITISIFFKITITFDMDDLCASLPPSSFQN